MIDIDDVCLLTSVSCTGENLCFVLLKAIKNRELYIAICNYRYSSIDRGIQNNILILYNNTFDVLI